MPSKQFSVNRRFCSQFYCEHIDALVHISSVKLLFTIVNFVALSTPTNIYFFAHTKPMFGQKDAMIKNYYTHMTDLNEQYVFISLCFCTLALFLSLFCGLDLQHDEADSMNRHTKYY